MAPKPPPANRKLEDRRHQRLTRGGNMVRAAKQGRPVEKRLAALEKAIQELQKTVGDLKYELEQMRED